MNSAAQRPRKKPKQKKAEVGEETKGPEPQPPLRSATVHSAVL